MLTNKVRNRLTGVYYHVPFEAIIWTAGLISLAICHPGEDSHVSICLFKGFGLTYCPGCGLGRSISYLLHGEILYSTQTHPLGIFAVIILMHRIFYLTRIFIRNTFLNKSQYG